MEKIVNSYLLTYPSNDLLKHFTQLYICRLLPFKTVYVNSFIIYKKLVIIMEEIRNLYSSKSLNSHCFVLLYGSEHS